MSDMATAHVITKDQHGTVGCASGATVVFGGIFIFALTRGSFGWTAIFAIPFVIALLVTAMAWNDTKKWGPLTASFSTWPLLLGSEEVVELKRQSLKNVPDAEYQMEAELSCEEAATYRVGTDTRTDTSTVYATKIPVKGAMRNNVFTAQVPLIIPVDRGAPSLDLDNNKIEWELKIDVDDVSSFQNKETFELTISNELHSSWRIIQDAPRGDL